MAGTPFDPTLKTLVETVPEDWPVFVGRARAPTEVIDADIATVSGAGDKVLRVRDDPEYLLHLEFVAGHGAAALPRKLNVRNVLLEDRHAMVVRSVAILLRREADSPQLTGERRVGFPGEESYNVFRYGVVRIWQLPAEPLLAGGIGTLPLAPISAVTEADLPGIIERMGRRLNARRMRSRAEQLWMATYLLMGLRYSPGLAERLLQGVVSMKESATYQAILAEGLAEGLSEGRSQGEVVGARKVLRAIGEDAFGPPEPQIVAALERINDEARLEELAKRVRHVGSWQELLRQPAPRRRNGRRRSP